MEDAIIDKHFILMSLSGTAEAEVQLRSISLRLENVSLSEALSRIEEASGYSFSMMRIRLICLVK